MEYVLMTALMVAVVFAVTDFEDLSKLVHGGTMLANAGDQVGIAELVDGVVGARKPN
jgi:hypothetical protein